MAIRAEEIVTWDSGRQLQKQANPCQRLARTVLEEALAIIGNPESPLEDVASAWRFLKDKNTAWWFEVAGNFTQKDLEGVTTAQIQEAYRKIYLTSVKRAW